jgi:4-carboxymuconolactone decarboxylase
MARLAPLDPPYDPEIAEALVRLMGSRDVEPLKLFRTIAHHPALLDRFRQIGSTMLSFGLLPDAEREVLIQRTTARCGAAYEWGVHAAVFAPQLGLDDEWLRATWAGDADDPAFTPRQALLIRFCDELHDGAAVSDDTYAALREAYDDDQLVELVCLAGFYHLVSFACGTFAIEQEEWAVAPPV